MAWSVQVVKVFFFEPPLCSRRGFLGSRYSAGLAFCVLPVFACVDDGPEVGNGSSGSVMFPNTAVITNDALSPFFLALLPIFSSPSSSPLL
jgi:hypothetical protein